MTKYRHFWVLLLWIIGFQLIGFVMGQLTQSNIANWYVGLNKSTLTPPNITFGIVWSLLYVVLAYIGFSLFSENIVKVRCEKIIYCLQMLLNWSWTPIFFSLHYIGIGLIMLIMMVLLNAGLCVLLYKMQKKLAILNAIYLLWLSFACYLNAYIFLNNTL